MPETHEKAYEIFKKTREERGLSLSEVANELHLTVTVIEQIEAGELVHRHLAPVFMRGYIRSYAKYLNLPESIVDEMISPLSVENPVKPTVEKSKLTYKQRGKKQRAKQPVAYNPKKILYYLLVVALLIIIASFWHSPKKPEVIPPTATVVAEQPENTLTEVDPASEPTDENLTNTPQVPDESVPPNAEEETALTPEQSVPEITPTPPVVETPPPAPVVVTPPPAPVKKAPAAPVPVVPTQPEVVDAQETP